MWLEFAAIAIAVSAAATSNTRDVEEYFILYTFL